MRIDAKRSQFSSTHSLYDYDIVFWDPLETIRGYALNADTYDGLPRITNAKSAALRRDLERRKNDFLGFLELGRTLVVFLGGELTVFADTGKRTYSGTGKNRKQTYIVDSVDIMDVLPIHLSREFTTGDELEPVDHSIGSIYRQTADFWFYGCILIESSDVLRPLLRISRTTKIAAAEAKYEGGGHMILLPQLVTLADHEDDDEEEDGSTGPEQSQSTPEDANDEDADTSIDYAAVDSMVFEWVRAHIRSEEIAWPDWIDEYRFQSEVDRRQAIAERGAAIAELQAQLDELNAAQEADKKWKLLVAGTGTPFEDVVADALTELGFLLEPTIPGRTDVRGTRGGASVVVETKGVSKSAAESHCAQLEKWVAEELEIGRKAKGILVINPWLKEPPLKRTGAAFPPQMRPYAEMRNHCLVTGLQLLNIARTAMREPARREELVALLLKTTGVIEGWDDPAQIFGEIPAGPAAKRTQRRTKEPDS